MLKTILVLPDGTELSSGAGTTNAIKSITVTECVNSGQELTLGSVCASMAELSLLTPGGEFSLAAGDEFTLCRQDDAGNRYKLGLFTAEKPTRPTANTMKLTAYDRVARLDRDLTGWLASLTQWPYSLGDLAYQTCQACGLEFISDELPNGTYPVQQFSADGITGRQIMKWIGEIAGCFCRATADGQIELAWYTPLTSVVYNNGDLNLASGEITVENGTLVSDTVAITADGNGNLSFTLPAAVEELFYYQNGLSFSDYSVTPVEKVQLRQNEEDVGTVYPDNADDGNTYMITGNYLLTAGSGDALRTIAQTLYERLQGVTYTPCTVQIPATMPIRAGSILHLTDRNGKAITAYIMTRTQSGQRDTLECTGSHRRDSSTAVNNQSFRALSGKVLSLRTDVDGIKAENADTDGKVARLQLDVAGITGEVSHQQETIDGLQEHLTSVQQTADSLSVQVKSIQQDGVSKVTNALGLTIDKTAVTISRSGSGMTNCLDERGMYVIRSKGAANEAVMLQADANGVIATDVSVRNYLVIGNYARLEDYNDTTGSKRTACFHIGGS